LNQFQLDSLYSKFLQLRAPELLQNKSNLRDLTLEDRKCGFSIITDVKSNLNSFSPEQQVVLNSILSRPSLQTSVVSPSGFFRIHYDETGFNRPAYNTSLTVEQNVAQVAAALDSSYRFEITYLGFLAPVGDNGAGGDDKYDIYIQNQSAGLYGYTEPEMRVGNVNWTSFIVIDNDYTGYYSSGINGMLVTVAHEFHHGIQIGNYSIPSDNSPYRNTDIFFYELTSTSMEDFVYDTVNDYYAYMASYFSHPDKAMQNQNGYNLAIWNLFLVESISDTVGFSLIKKQWELIPSIPAIQAINSSLTYNDLSFPGLLNKFGIWTYYTKNRSIPGSYFEEASNYPLIQPTANVDFIVNKKLVQINSYPAANNFVKFNIYNSGDTLYALVTNGNALQNPNQTVLFEYTLYSNSSEGTRQLTENYSSTFTTSNPSYWSVSEILNSILVRSDSATIPTININQSLAYPNPFKYEVVSNLNIALQIKSGTQVDFQVYTPGLKLVYSATKVVGVVNNSPNIEWDGLDNSDSKLASGVYIYVIKYGDEVIKGKVVIFNE
jgi:hypothetical protein